MLLGNDIVDLKEAPEASRRFLERVFAPAERECIAGARDPALALWMLWSGKESAFKIARKLRPEAVFAHRDYVFTDETLALVGSCDPLGEKLSASLLYQQLQISLCWQWNRDYVHCVAGWRAGEVFAGERLLSSCCQRISTLNSPNRVGALSAREEESVHSPESREVRLLAKQLLVEQHQLRSPEILREKDSSRLLPPVVWEGGEPAAGIDLSLSHDGRFVSAVVSSA